MLSWILRNLGTRQFANRGSVAYLTGCPYKHGSYIFIRDVFQWNSTEGDLCIHNVKLNLVFGQVLHYTTIYFSCDQTTKWTPKVFISLIISYKQEMRIVTFTEKPISNLFLRRQSKRYRCTSSIAIYAWRVTVIFNKFSDAWWRCTSCHDDYLRRHSSGICGIWTVCNRVYRKGNIIFNNVLFTVHNKC